VVVGKGGSEEEEVTEEERGRNQMQRRGFGRNGSARVRTRRETIFCRSRELVG
jgi:hypothetical protein